MEKDKRITLPPCLRLAVASELKDSYGIDKWKEPGGMVRCCFSEDELSKIKQLRFENALRGDLEGLELLPNLKHLSVECTSDYAYNHPHMIESIDDNDIACIEKCKQLESLSLINLAYMTKIDLSGLPELRILDINYNTHLEKISGLDKLSNLSFLSCYGNETLQDIKGLDKTIVQNKENLQEMELDMMLFPKAIGYNVSNGSYNQEAVNALEDINTFDGIRWSEALLYDVKTQINTPQMLRMHNKACRILDANVPRAASVKDTVVAVERYLAENVIYDVDSVNTKNRAKKRENGTICGAKYGVNGAYDCLVLNSCVCQGYTRGEQYLLGLRGIKSREVFCISGKDTLRMSDKKNAQDLNHHLVKLPEHGYHSIIRIDDYYGLYSDPCWNADYYQHGYKSMPYTLLTKDEIRQTHTLSYNEANVENEASLVMRSEVAKSLDDNEAFRKTRLREVQEQRVALNPNVRGVVRSHGGKTY